MFLLKNIHVEPAAAGNSATGIAVDTANLVVDLRAEDYSGSGNWQDATSNNNHHIFPSLSHVSYSSSNKSFYSSGGNAGSLASTISGISTSDGAVSLEAWVKFRTGDFSADIHGGILGFMRKSGTQAGQGMGFQRKTTNNVTKYYFRTYDHSTDDYDQTSGNSEIQLGQWYHLVSTHHASGWGTQYINGSLTQGAYLQHKYVAPSTTSTLSLILANDAYLSSGSNIKFEIGQFRAYKKELSAAEVLSNFQNTDEHGYYSN